MSTSSVARGRRRGAPAHRGRRGAARRQGGRRQGARRGGARVRRPSPRAAGGGPGLAVVQVGEDPASSVYVRNKRKSSLEAGIESFAHDLPASTSEAQILALVRRAQPRPARRRHPGAAAAAQGRRHQPCHGRGGSGQGCRRLSSGEHRPAGAEAAAAAAVHALRRHPPRAGVRHRSHRRCGPRWWVPPTSSAARWRSSCCWRAPR